jgi:hypothetical protein
MILGLVLISIVDPSIKAGHTHFNVLQDKDFVNEKEKKKINSLEVHINQMTED